MTGDLTRAAEILDEYATLLFEMNTVDGEWIDAEPGMGA